ncbi:MAG: hypothetical protein FWF83_00190 [Clostridiales bacterium]|nr:hypothetical protein [Clostridiales bacterium]
MYVSIAYFSELLEIICGILKLLKEDDFLADDKKILLEQKAIEFIDLAVDTYEQAHVHLV